MSIARRRQLLPALIALVLSARNGQPSTIAIAYLQQASDRYQKTINVYKVADDAGNHFPARGEFDNFNGAGPVQVPTMDEISPNAPCPEITCITASFDPRRLDFGGWYFMNGTLGPTDRQPSPNWGVIPNAGFGDIPVMGGLAVTGLEGATALQFKVRGQVGGEKLLFFCCGVGYNPDTAGQTAPFPDSAGRVSILVTATTDWVQHSIDLTGVDLSYVLGGFGWVASAADQANPSPITFYLSDIQFVKGRPNDPRLLVSYETIKSALSFDAVERNAAYIYDNAVAIMALIANGDVARARTIGDALIYAQNHDRFFNGRIGPADGRLRNAYQGSDIALPAGWIPNNEQYTARMPGWYSPDHATWFEDETQVSTSTGNVAWAGLAFLDLYENTKDPKYLAAAQKLGDWLLNYAADNPARGDGGFTGGYEGWESLAAAQASSGPACAGKSDNGQCKRLYKSTEHNIDLYSFFARLYLADPAGGATWAPAAQNAKHFFLSMWDSAGSSNFWTGTSEDGVTISKDVIPVDIQAWSLLALGSEAQPYQDRALSFVESHHKTSAGYGFKQNDASDSCGVNTWFEGTSQVATAYYQAGNTAKWQSVLAGIHGAQLPSGAVPATDGTCLNTGFFLNDNSPWLYYPRAHVGATAWLGLAENGVNPYRAYLYSPALSASTVKFPDSPVNSASAVQMVRLRNPGPSTLSLVSLSTTGTNATDFAQTNSCGGVVQPGAFCDISVTFAPTAQGARQASLVIQERSDPLMQSAAYTVMLSGMGTTPASQVFTLNVQVSPSGAGSITSMPQQPLAGYPAGARVCFSATASAGYVFQGWAGAALDYTGCLVMTANSSVTAEFAPAKSVPSIQLTSLSSFGAMPGTIAGVVKGIDPSKYKIALLLFLTGQGWFSKPYCDSTTVTLAQDGSFSTVFTTGGVDQQATRFAIVAVPVSSNIPCYTSYVGIPADLLQQSIAQLVVNRPNPNEREIQFAGQPWAVKASTVPVGPGGCVFSDSSDSVFVDAQRNLHLRILNGAAGWSCAEVYSRGPVGYGIYTWTIAGLPVLDSSTVFGAFTWADGQEQAREIDVEVGFGSAGSATNAQFVVQPANAANLFRISLPVSTPITFTMSWMPGALSFQAFQGTDDAGKQLAQWSYPGTVPPADQRYENFRFNLWLNGAPPASGQTQEAVVSNFQYQPFVADTTLPLIDSFVNGADFVAGSAPGAVSAAFGRNLASQAGASTDPPLPSTFHDVVVTVNGIPAPLFYVSQSQTNVQIPYISPVGPSLVGLTVNGRSSQLFPVNLAPAAPGLFTGLSQSCLVQNQDYSLNSPSAPAAPGSEIMAYLTGIGQVNNPVPSGSPAPTSPLSRAILGSTAVINGQTAPIDFLGLVPGFVGVGQANIHVPVNISSGLSSLVITIGGIHSNSCSLSITGGSNSSPVLIGVGPSSGPQTGGTVVTINGSNFVAGATVKFGSMAATAVNVTSANTIQATTPPGSAIGSVNVTITNPNGDSGTLPNGFRYLGPAPVITSMSPTSGPTVGGTVVTFSGSNFVSGATVSFNGPAATNVTVVNANTLQATSPPGQANSSVRPFVTNPDGQMANSPTMFSYVSTVPLITYLTPTSGPQSGGTVVTINGSNFVAGATVKFGSMAATAVNVTSANTIQATTPPGSAIGSVNVTITNPNGDSGTLPNGFRYLGPAPIITSMSPTSGPTVGGTVVTFSGSNFVSGATVSFNGPAATNVTVVNANTLQATSPPGQANSSVRPFVTNPDGQMANSPTMFSYVSTVPLITYLTPTSGPQSGGTVVTINGSNFVAGATVKFGSMAATAVNVTSANTIQATTPPGSAIGSVNVTITNPNGDSGTLPNGFRYLGPAPIITSMSPTSGPTVGGTVVTFSGSNFVSGATVSFNGPAATNVTVVNANTLQATSPPGQANSSVRPFVTNPDGQMANSPTMFSYVSTVPLITYLTPTSGPQSGGTVVTINGSNFVAGATVKFGSMAATAVNVTSANTIQATTPPGSAIGSVNVTITNPNGDSGTLPNGFRYLGPAPVITSMSPTSGPTVGGTVVTFSGSNFVSGATVSFNGPAATNVTVVNANTLQATSPPGQANSSVRPFVTNPDGQMANSPTMFSYVSTVPLITYLTPTSGPQSGGTVVTINGSNFVAGATVKFGSMAATAVNVTSANTIQATTPAGSGTVSVILANPDGESVMLLNAFTYQGVTNPNITASVQAGKISGTVTGVNPPQSFKVVAYALTNSYYIQPCVTEPLTPIASNGTWGPIDSHDGTIFAILVSASYSPPTVTSSLPSVDGINVLAATGPSGVVSGYDVARCPAQ